MRELSEEERQAGAIGAFARERVVAEAEATPEEHAVGAPEVRELYGEYVKFCGEYNGVIRFGISTEESQNRFARRFGETCLKAYRHRTSKMVEGKRVNVSEWLGIRLRSSKPLFTSAEVELIGAERELARMEILLERFKEKDERRREKPWYPVTAESKPEFIKKHNEEVRAREKEIEEQGKKAAALRARQS